MGRPRLYATSVERKAAWRRRHGMAVRPHYPSAAAKQAAYRARKRHAARDLAAQECAAIQQALQTRTRADQCWEMHDLIDAWSRDADMPRRVPAGRPAGLLAGTSAHFYGGPRRAYAGIGGRSSVWRTSGPPAAARVGAPSDAVADSAQGCASLSPTRTVRGSCEEDVA